MTTPTRSCRCQGHRDRLTEAAPSREGQWTGDHGRHRPDLARGDGAGGVGVEPTPGDRFLRRPRVPGAVHRQRDGDRGARPAERPADPLQRHHRVGARQRPGRDGLWIPWEHQLRALLGDRFAALERVPGEVEGYRRPRRRHTTRRRRARARLCAGGSSPPSAPGSVARRGGGGGGGGEDERGRGGGGGGQGLGTVVRVVGGGGSPPDLAHVADPPRRHPHRYGDRRLVQRLEPQRHQRLQVVERHLVGREVVEVTGRRSGSTSWASTKQRALKVSSST